MFDLEKSISVWRKQMLAAGIGAPAPLEELEIHLRDEIERQMKNGLNEQEVIDSAVQKIGQAQDLKAEFSKINKLKMKEIMKNSRIASNLSLAVVLLAAVWLMFSAVMIGKDLFLDDGLIPVRLSDGAQVQIQNSLPVLQGEGTMATGEKYQFTLIPALAIPFVILVAFAIMGCRSLSQKQTNLTAQTQRVVSPS